MPAPTLSNIAKVWGQQCDPYTRPGTQVYFPNGFIDAKTGYVYGVGNWCVSYDGETVTQPFIGPIPPPETTGGVGSPPAPIKIGCGCHKGTVTTAPTPAPAPTPKPVVAPVFVDRFKGLPWWVYVLAALALSQLFNRGQARG
jgi:hypothetical protein